MAKTLVWRPAEAERHAVEYLLKALLAQRLWASVAPGPEPRVVGEEIVPFLEGIVLGTQVSQGEQESLRSSTQDLIDAIERHGKVSLALE